MKNKFIIILVFICFSMQLKLYSKLNKDDVLLDKKEEFKNSTSNDVQNSPLQSKVELNPSPESTNNSNNQTLINNNSLNNSNSIISNSNQTNNNTIIVKPTQPELYKPSIMIPAVKACATPIVRPILSQPPTQQVISQPMVTQKILEQPVLYQAPNRVMTSHEFVPQQTVMQVVDNKIPSQLINSPTHFSEGMIAPIQKITSVTPTPLMNTTPLLRQNGRIGPLSIIDANPISNEKELSITVSQKRKGKLEFTISTKPK